MMPFDSVMREMPDIANDAKAEVAGKLAWVGMKSMSIGSIKAILPETRMYWTSLYVNILPGLQRLLRQNQGWIHSLKPTNPLAHGLMRQDFVTGDKALLALQQVLKLPVISPRQFWEMLASFDEPNWGDTYLALLYGRFRGNVSSKLH